MGPVGRLWRRAPAWRLLLATAVASTALAAMFPPPFPAGLVRGHASGATESAGRMQTALLGSGTASFRPLPARAASDYSTVVRPALGTPRSGTIAFNGRQLPLPTGDWQVIEIGRFPGALGALNVQVESLMQMKERTITGVLVALTPDPVSGGLPPPTFMQTCLAINPLAGQITPPDPAKPLANECWVVTDAVLTAAKDGAAGAVNLSELDRFRAAGLTVPEHVVALDYRRSDRDGWWSVTLFVPQETARSPAALHKLQLWAKTYAASLHRGFDTPSR